jgi:hypothetical protein
MNHLDEAILVAVRDREDGYEPATAHLAGCSMCTDELEEVERRAQVLGEALASLDEHVDVVRAKAAVRGRLDARREEAGAPRRMWRGHVGRAAAIVLLTAGAASALPWSPVRHWWVGEQAETPTVSGPVGAAPQAAASLAGISVAVPQGRIAVIVRGARAGTEIEVVWVDQATARVSAPSGSGFTYGDGRAEVMAAPGPIRVELPRDASFASLEVDGRVFLERSADGLAVPGPAVERSEAGIRFVVDAP